MDDNNATFWYALLADVILVVHFAFVLFVLLGLINIYLGKLLNWSWVRNRKFRITHLGAIGFVAFETIIGMVCPLTTWEYKLRLKAGQVMPEDYSFVAYYVNKLLFFEGPTWVFTTCYIIIFIAIACSWWVVKPNPKKSKLNNNSAHIKAEPDTPEPIIES